jgi:hypothetical protein
MAQEEAADDNSRTNSQPHCEIIKSILEEECQRPGEVRYGGIHLCGPHAELLGLEDRTEALLGSVFRMDEWMEENGNGSAAADEEFVGRLRQEREEAVAALRLTRAQLRSTRKALSVGR